MKRHKGFTLIELLVVISIIALLLAILMPSLRKVRDQAKAVVCASRLGQWGLVWEMYTADNNGRFHGNAGGTGGCNLVPKDISWPEATRSYYVDPRLRCCPTATKPQSEGGRGTFSAYGIYGEIGEPYYKSWAIPGDYGSYGLNGWVWDPPPEAGIWNGNGDNPKVNLWRTVNIRGPLNNIPVFMDALWYWQLPKDADEPPRIEGFPCPANYGMTYFCINRHSGAINILFMDWSVRRIGLKDLWKLKWHRSFDINGPWTEAGGVQPDNWPDWMKKF